MHVNARANKSLLWSCAFLPQLFIRTLLRFRWNRNFSKGSSNGALISLTFPVVTGGLPRTTAENKKGAPPNAFSRMVLSKQYVTPGLARRAPHLRDSRDGRSSGRTHAQQTRGGSTCGREAWRRQLQLWQLYHF